MPGAVFETIGELATQAHYRQKIVNVVINNRKLGRIRLWQGLSFSSVQSAAQPGTVHRLRDWTVSPDL